ncbi:S1 RNA-binding domain-containing protein, partial [Salmonella enterica subsp. enterica serovar Typhi]|nr:S1 RNA-binding domain-containing protein [Salmonella enterica subsp. enterica serovar Typhi]
MKRLKLRTKMKIGDKLKGRITGIQPYGAFVELETGVIGLI